MSPDFRRISERLGVRRLFHHEQSPANPPFIGTTEQENNSLPPDIALRFGYIEINGIESDEYKEAA
jgi:hypothetical protein